MMRTPRRGSAIILVLIMTMALAGLALSAIYMAGSSGMLSRYHDKERDVALAVETALELGKSRLQRDTTLVLYDTGYTQLLTDQPVYDAAGGEQTGLTVNLYAGNTGDTSGVYVPYVTLLATVSDAYGLRLARRMDLYQQSFSRYGLFTNDFPSAASIGAGENVGGRVHSNNRFTAASSGSPYPVFSDTVSAAGTISGNGQWADTVSSAGGTTVVPYPSATNLFSYYSALANAGDLNYTIGAGLSMSAYSAGVNVSGTTNATANYTGRAEFLTVDVNNNGMIDSTEGFMKVFILWPGYGGDSTRLNVNFSGSPVANTQPIMNNQCGAFYTVLNPTNGRVQREFFPIAMHRTTWVRNRIQTSTYPTVSGVQAGAMAAATGSYPTQAAIRTILQQPTARCFPYGSPYLMNVERFTNKDVCAQRWDYGDAVQMYTWGSANGVPGCAAANRYGGQDSTFTHYSFTCVVDWAYNDGRCLYTGTAPSTYDPAYLGEWMAYGGTSSLPALPAAVRQNVERSYLWPLSPTYNPNSRGVVYLTTSSTTRRTVYLSGTVRGRVTVYVNGVATLIDDLTYDQDPADSTNLCRNFLGLIARDSIMVADNAINRPRNYDAASPDYTLTLGGNRDFIFHGIAMALGGSVNAFNPNVATATNPVYTCPTGSSFTAAGGCLQIVGGTVMKTYAAPYTSTANSGFRPLRERDPCQMTNMRPPYFPIAKTRVQPYKTFDVDVRQVKTATLLTAYFTRLRGSKAAP
ncbi:MAG: hypothetical protein ACYC3L_06230 [Gemmatimonadaceae bacterium]